MHRSKGKVSKKQKLFSYQETNTRCLKWARFGKAQNHWRETHVGIKQCLGERIFLKISTGEQLIYCVVLVSAVQHSESEIYTHISTLVFLLRFFSRTGRYRILSTVPCAIQ